MPGVTTCTGPSGASLPQSSDAAGNGIRVRQRADRAITGRDVAGRVRQMRDPYVFQDGGKTYVFYAVCGEQGVTGAEIVLPS
jgi:hypothetical protein